MNPRLLSFLNARYDAWPAGNVKLCDLRAEFFGSLSEHEMKCWTPARLEHELSEVFAIGTDDRSVKRVAGLTPRDAAWVQRRGRLVLDAVARVNLQRINGKQRRAAREASKL